MSELERLAAGRPYLEQRCRIVYAMRRFFLESGFLEVQTPLRTAAPAPERHIEPFASEDRFLITSPELHMKRMLAAGYERIFQIGPVFRKGERGRRHHPEFTMIEWYRRDADYRDLQQDCRALITWICESTGRRSGFFYGETRLAVSGDWPVHTVRSAFLQWAGWDPVAAFDPERFDRDLVETVEPHLGFPLPAFLTDYPAEQAALARLKSNDPRVAERFELYWAGVELANGFSELTDPVEQRKRFLQVVEERERARAARPPMPEAFLESLERMPPRCAGIALGVDRLVMVLCGARSLDQVVAFPPEEA